MKSAVVVFPGSNCDRDLAVALEQITGRKANMVWHKEPELPEGTDFIGIPGGFSYGDYLRSGAMAARSPVMRAVKDAAARGVPVIGICNGFQVLTEAGLLPGALMRNARLSFVCREVPLRVENSQSLFTANYETGETVTFRSPTTTGITRPIRKRSTGLRTKVAWRSAILKIATARPVRSPAFSTIRAMCSA